MNPQTEAELVVSANAGDEAAFASLFREHTPAMRSVAASLFRRLQLYPAWQLAEDAAQEAWLRQPLRGFDASRGKLRSLLCAQTKRAAIDVARKLVGKRLTPRIEREVTALANHIHAPARSPQQEARLELSVLFSGKCRVRFPSAEKATLQRWMTDEAVSATSGVLGLSESRVFRLRASAVERMRTSLARARSAA